MHFLLSKNSLLFLFIATSVACSPVRVVSTDAKKTVDYTAYQTFNFLDVSLKNETSPVPEIDHRGIQLLKAAISKEMQSLGYHQSENPDLWVNIGIMVEEKVQTRQTDIREAPVYIGQRRYHWESEEVVVDKYEQGTVSIDIIDTRKMERIWEGVAAGTLSSDGAKLENRINKAMQMLFDKYPMSPD